VRRLLAVVRSLFSLGYVRYRIARLGHDIFESVLWQSRMQCGQNVRIHPTASIRNPHNVVIGDNSHINLWCCVWAGETSKIIIGKNLLMGPCVQLHASRHGMEVGLPMTEQPRVFEDIVIGDDCWLCAGAIITAGVRIADGVVVAANAVVTRDILEENVIVGGVPARITGRRGSSQCSETRNKEADSGSRPSDPERASDRT